MGTFFGNQHRMRTADFIGIADTAEWLPQLADASFDGVTALIFE